MTSTSAEAVRDLRYEPEDQPPPALALGLGFQLAMLTVAGIVLTPAIVVRAAGGSDDFLSWATFAALAISGVTTVLQAVRRTGRRRPRTGDGDVGRLHRSVRHGAPRGRAGAAGDAGHRLGAVPVRDLHAVVAAAPDTHADSLRHGDHADPGDPDADHVRHAGRRAGRVAAGRRAGQRHHDLGRHGRGSRSAPPASGASGRRSSASPPAARSPARTASTIRDSSPRPAGSDCRPAPGRDSTSTSASRSGRSCRRSSS